MLSRKTNKTRDTKQASKFGTLQSELDEPVQLRADFARIADAVDAAKAQYQAGELNKTQYAKILTRLRLTTADGATWTVGATTGRWYRRLPGGIWIPEIPPAADDPFGAASSVDVVEEYLSHSRDDKMSPVSGKHRSSPQTPVPIPLIPEAPKVSGLPEAPAGAPAPVTDEATRVDAPAVPTREATGDADATPWESTVRTYGYDIPEDSGDDTTANSAEDSDGIADLGLPPELFE